MSGLIHRRGLLGGLGALFAAPAIVRASSLMPVKAIDDMPLWGKSPMMGALEDLQQINALYFAALFKTLNDSPSLTATQIIAQINERNLLVRA